jgi:tRNA threonylcarbamoyladenosine biosynthesis protein TsaB
VSPHPIFPRGLVLAFDTSGPRGYVGVSKGQNVVAQHRLEDPGRHAARLVPAIGDVLETAGAVPEDLVGIVVGEGPGSFTGVRVAAATGKGLARALGIPLYPVSSLAAAALSGPDPHASGVRYVLFDARGERVFAACFEIGPHRLDALIDPHAGDLRSVLEDEVPTATVFLGSGAQRHRSAIEARGHDVLDPPWGEPAADALLHALALQASAPVTSLSTWEPRYLKSSSAERAWVK